VKEDLRDEDGSWELDIDGMGKDCSCMRPRRNELSIPTTQHKPWSISAAPGLLSPVMDIEYVSNLFSTWIFVLRGSTAPQYLSPASPAPLLCIHTLILNGINESLYM